MRTHGPFVLCWFAARQKERDSLLIQEHASALPLLLCVQVQVQVQVQMVLDMQHGINFRGVLKVVLYFPPLQRRLFF